MFTPSPGKMSFSQKHANLSTLINWENLSEYNREYMQNISSLDISSAELKQIPENICKCKNVIYIVASWNKISCLRPISNMYQLTHLAINGCKITDLSPITNLKNLIWLDASHNEIQEIPRSFLEMNIVNLFLSNNLLTSQSIKNLCPNLSLLDISLNKNLSTLQALPSTLHTFYAQDCNISKIDTEFYKMNNLSICDLSRNNIDKMDQNISCMLKLEILKLNNNILTIFPNLHAGSIIELDLSNNLLTSMGTVPYNVKKLSLHNNRFIRLPNVMNTVNLRELYFHDNIDYIIPHNLYELNIEKFTIGHAETHVKNISLENYFTFRMIIDLLTMKKISTSKNRTYTCNHVLIFDHNDILTMCNINFCLESTKYIKLPRELQDVLLSYIFLEFEKSLKKG